jgi:hypothetical protein
MAPIFVGFGSLRPNWRCPHGAPDDAQRHDVLVQGEQDDVSLAVQDRRDWPQMQRIPGQVYPLGGSGIGNPDLISTNTRPKSRGLPPTWPGD